MENFQWPALATLGIVALLFLVSGNTGRLRHKHRIRAPAMTGHPEFERAFRVQMNTIENAIIVLPVLWLFAIYVNAVWSAALAAVWIAARAWYAIAYMGDPERRAPSFGLSMVAFAVLAVGALWGVLRQFVH